MRDDLSTALAAIRFARVNFSLKGFVLGAVCCARCNDVIPQERLEAVPDVLICTNCRSEEELKWKTH
jgi:formylmethanofuran dehydrogenase subunit E